MRALATTIVVLLVASALSNGAAPRATHQFETETLADYGGD